MSSTSATGAAKGFDQIPVFHFPQDYATTMPAFLGKTAQELGPIFRRHTPAELRPYFGEWIVYLAGPEANRFVLHTHRDAFSHDRGWTPMIGEIFERGLLNTDDPEHARDRKMMNPAFAISYMSRYLPIMSRIFAERTNGWVERGVVDLYDEMRKITFDVAAECLVGLRTGPQVDRLQQLFYSIMYGSGPSAMQSMHDLEQGLFAARDEMNAILLRMIAERRTAPTDDILGMLVQAMDEDGKPFTDKQLLGQIHILLLAGHETTTTLAAWLFYLLATHPDHLARVRREIAEVMSRHDTVTLDALKEMAELTRVVDEVGRLYSPVGNVPRGAVKDFEFAGYHVPAGTRVWLSLVASHRDPRLFAHPERFDPDRFAPPRSEGKTPYSLVPFGGGPRICLGINLAQVEIKAMAAYVLPRLEMTPVPGAVFQQAYLGPTAVIVGGLPMRVTTLNA
ncbi:MAG TPA: cytochrome P450 [Ktedonobacterales bacterium]